MSQTNETTDHKRDDQLADFTDQVLEGTMKTASSLDQELLSLEETVLRLNRSFPPASLDDTSKKQMLVRLKARVKREEKMEKPSFWKRWFDIQSNPQVGMILAAVAVLVLMVIGIPALTSTDGSLSGTAVNPSGGNVGLIAAGLIGVLLLVYWFARKK